MLDMCVPCKAFVKDNNNELSFWNFVDLTATEFEKPMVIHHKASRIQYHIIYLVYADRLFISLNLLQTVSDALLKLNTGLSK